MDKPRGYWVFFRRLAEMIVLAGLPLCSQWAIFFYGTQQGWSTAATMIIGQLVCFGLLAVLAVRMLNYNDGQG